MIFLDSVSQDVFAPSFLMRLSQGQLNSLERCPRQFQHTYLDQISSPTSIEQQERQTWGSRFHLLMQQRELGLPIESLVQEDTQMRSWMTAFTSAAPEILAGGEERQMFRESEHCRTLQVQDYLLTVVYDLLIADELQAQILDWKTYPKPQNRRRLAENWQTLLYLYVLAETSEYPPEQISLTYWFVQSAEKPQSLKFTYSMSQHQKIGQKLHRLLNQLSNYLETYQTGQFPQTQISQVCDSCAFAVRCDRSHKGDDSKEAIASSLVPNLANIEEVSL